MADGERNHVRSDAVELDVDRRYGFGQRNVCLDDAYGMPSAGTESESVTFMPSDTADYNAVTGSVTVTVSRPRPR